MKLKTFQALIKLSKELNKKQSLINKECKKLFGKEFQFSPYNEIIDEITKILMKEYNDKASWIDWWIYEKDYGKKELDAFYKNGTKIKLDTVKQLYKFLLENYQDIT